MRMLTVFGLIFCLLLCSCSSKEMNRALEDMIGSAARTKIKMLGQHDRKCYLVRLNMSKEYAIVVPSRIIRFGEDVIDVIAKNQFVQNDVDYAVLELKGRDGSISNYLLQLYAANKLYLFDLASSSGNPFEAYRLKGNLYLTQTTGKASQIRVWLIENGNLYGPSLKPASFLTGGAGKKSAGAKKSGSAKTQPDMPRIKQDTGFKIELDQPQERPAAPAPAPAAPAAPQPGVPAKSGTDPYTIVID